jgi:hypothetical protein
MTEYIFTLTSMPGCAWEQIEMKNSCLMLSASMLRPQSAGRSEINIHVSHDFGPSAGFSSNPTAEFIRTNPHEWG